MPALLLAGPVTRMASPAMKRWFAWIAIALGLALMIVNIAGLFVPISEHPAAARKPVHKTNLSRLSYPETLEALNRLDKNQPVEEVISEANRIIAARIVHYWPNPGKTDSRTMHSFLENWFLAGLQRGEAWLASIGLAEVKIARTGRRDFHPILAKGVGLCGMAAMALVHALREKDIPAKILVLAGHIVVYASVDGRNFILDPDHAVIIRDVPAPPAQSLSKIVSAYQEAGYEPRKVQKLERKYAAAPVGLYELEQFQRGNRRLLIAAAIVKWAVPLALLALGGFLWRRASPLVPVKAQPVDASSHAA